MTALRVLCCTVLALCMGGVTAFTMFAVALAHADPTASVVGMLIPGLLFFVMPVYVAGLFLFHLLMVGTNGLERRHALRMVLSVEGGFLAFFWAVFFVVL